MTIGKPSYSLHFFFKRLDFQMLEKENPFEVGSQFFFLLILLFKAI